MVPDLAVGLGGNAIEDDGHRGLPGGRVLEHRPGSRIGVAVGGGDEDP